MRFFTHLYTFAATSLVPALYCISLLQMETQLYELLVCISSDSAGGSQTLVRFNLKRFPEIQLLTDIWMRCSLTALLQSGALDVWAQPQFDGLWAVLESICRVGMMMNVFLSTLFKLFSLCWDAERRLLNRLRAAPLCLPDGFQAATVPIILHWSESFSSTKTNWGVSAPDVESFSWCRRLHKLWI